MTVAERVAAGAALLDEKMPGWHARIRLPELNLGSECQCVLGQVYGHYLTGLKALWPEREFESRACGFMWLYDPETGDEDADDIEALDAEWRRVIEARRS